MEAKGSGPKARESANREFFSVFGSIARGCHFCDMAPEGVIHIFDLRVSIVSDVIIPDKVQNFHRKVFNEFNPCRSIGRVIRSTLNLAINSVHLPFGTLARLYTGRLWRYLRVSVIYSPPPPPSQRYGFFNPSGCQKKRSKN